MGELVELLHMKERGLKGERVKHQDKISGHLRDIVRETNLERRQSVGRNPTEYRSSAHLTKWAYNQLALRNANLPTTSDANDHVLQPPRYQL